MIPYFLLFIFICAVYLPHVAPTIGTGAAGIITAAVSAGGMGPVPGYPVHNAFSKLLLLFPFERADYAVNLVSFLFAAGSLVLLTALVARLVYLYLGEKPQSVIVLAAGVFMAWAYFGAPGLARISYFGDRYTLELFSVLVAAHVFLSAMTGSAPKALPWLAFFAVFQFFCHPKSLPVTSTLLVLAIWHAWKDNLKIPWRRMIFFGAAGVLPLLYLPLLSLTNPLFDWGNPENLTNLWRSLSRREYAGLPVLRSWPEIYGDGVRQYKLLAAQFPPWFWIVIAGGFVALWRKNWKWGALAAGFVLLSGEATTALIHWPYHGGVRGEMGDSYMVSYYGPYFAGFILFAAFALTVAVARSPATVRPHAGLAMLVLLLAFTWRDHRRNSEAQYGFTTETLHNFEQLLPKGSILFTNNDGLFGPLVANQVRGALPGRAVVHLELLFRSWYYADLERLYPEIWRKHEKRFAALRDLIKNFEDSGFDENRFKVKTYYENVNALAAENAEAGSYIFLDPDSQPLRAGLFKAFQWEPEGLAFRLLKMSYRIHDVAFDRFRFVQLKVQLARGDYWATRFHSVFERILDLRLNRTQILKSEELPRLQKLVDEIRRP